MHNLTTVIRFEILRTLKKKSFWFMAFGFPVMIVIIFGIIYFSNVSTNEAAKNLGKQTFTIAITDDSGLIKPELITSIKAKTINDKNDGINDVKQGKIDGYFYYPKDLSKNPIEIYGQDVGIFENGRYAGVANSLLTQSVSLEVSQTIQTVLSGHTNNSVKTYKSGELSEPFKQMILPGVFLILFYLLISFFGNQILTSTTEEKENRVIEMILTTIGARTLIIGKIISLMALAMLQGLLIIIPVLIAYFTLHNQLSMPFIDLSSLPVDWLRISISAVLFILGFSMFTGLLVLVGASMPTAKEAGQFFGIIMLLIFGPLYAAPLFISAPESLVVQILSFFPLTAPIPLLLRNAVGTLPLHDVLVAIPIITVSSVFILFLAVRVFRYGALEYSRRLSIREILSRK